MIKMTEYAKRRKQLMQTVGANSIVIIPSAKEMLRNGDAMHYFRQNSDFYYLTGFDEPDAVLVLAPKREEGEYVLFNRLRDRSREIWDGPRAGQEGACKEFLADQSFPITDLEKILPSLLGGREVVHYPFGINKEFDQVVLGALNNVRALHRSGLQAPTHFADVTPTIHEMRLIKSAAEVAIMQTAANITANAHIRAMQTCRPGMFEYQLEAEIMHEFIRHGSRFSAYGNIIGSGRNSCVLHYVSNNKQIQDGDLVLIDAGAEYQNYAADVTRTFPANGRFTPEQKAIYEIVLESQLAAIQAIKPGMVWTTPQEKVVKVITQGLIDVGILKGKLDQLIEKQAYLPFYMHRPGHYLGLDVHDVGRYKVANKWRKLVPGIAFTVEPGIYISADIPGVHKRWHNIGVRIEDDVCVTKNGCDVLSRAVPKTVKEIEDLMAG